MPDITIHGLMRSGTNIVTWLLQHNYGIDVGINSPRWKHGAKTLAEYGNPVVVSVRHPLSWLVSLHERATATVNLDKDFRSWLLDDSCWHPYNRQPEMWSFAYGYWLAQVQMSPDAIYLVTMENILRSPCTECNTIVEALGRDPIGESEFEVPEEYVGPHHGKQDDPGGWADVKRRVIDEKTYLAHYSRDMLEHIERHVDPVVFDAFGYRWPGEAE